MAIGLALLAAASLAGASAPGDANSAEISVLTYNVHGLPWPFAKGRTRQLREIGDELGKLRAKGSAPDIVLIQEGFTGEVAELIRLSGYRYWAQGPSRGDRAGLGPDGRRLRGAVRYRQAGEGWGKLTSAGLYVLSDHPVGRVASQPYAACAGWDCLANKGVMLAHVAIAGVPGGIDVVNTHLNSRKAAKVPLAWSMKAYDGQISQMNDFVERHRAPDALLLVGGDFNVRRSPERYSQITAAKAFSVVSEYCHTSAEACGLAKASANPWLDSQDLQGFTNAAGVTMRPIRTQAIFDATTTPRLSDHAGYLVRYRLSWQVPAPVSQIAELDEDAPAVPVAFDLNEDDLASGV